MLPGGEEEGAALPSRGMLANTLGIHMQPYLEGTTRVALAGSQEVSGTVLNLLTQAREGAAAKASQP